MKSPKNRLRHSTRLSIQPNNLNSFDYFKNNVKIMKINENIQNEISSKEIKKKINLMTRSIIRRTSKNLKNLIIEEESKSQLDELEKIQRTISKRLKEEIENEEQSNACLKIDINDGNTSNKNIDKNRKIKRVKDLYDSLDDDENEEDTNDEYYIQIYLPLKFLII